MNTVFNVLGWLGAVILIAGFYANTTNKISSEDKVYHVLNIVAGLALGVSSYYYGAIFSVALNSFWVIIACLGLYKN